MTDLRPVVVAALLLAALAGTAKAGTDPSGEFVVGMHVDVAPDGHVVAVEPEAGTLPALRDALIQRAAQWHFTPATWRGKPVAVREWLPLEIGPVPTTGGGYAIRIVGTGHKPEPGTSMVPPRYPQAAMRAGIGAELMYQVHVAEDGRMTPVALLEPRAVKGHVKSLDEASRAALSVSRRRPATADGQVIACEMRFPIIFRLDRRSPPKRESDTLLPDQCPRAKLETEIAGTML